MKFETLRYSAVSVKINRKIFFVHFMKYEFCAYLARIYFRECRLKENFAAI